MLSLNFFVFTMHTRSAGAIQAIEHIRCCDSARPAAYNVGQEEAGAH